MLPFLKQSRQNELLLFLGAYSSTQTFLSFLLEQISFTRT